MRMDSVSSVKSIIVSMSGLVSTSTMRCRELRAGAQAQLDACFGALSLTQSNTNATVVQPCKSGIVPRSIQCYVTENQALESTRGVLPGPFPRRLSTASAQRDLIT